MEKLLDLLQEFYGDNRTFSNDDGLLTMTNGVENLSGAYAQTYIISKQGGFIKWLVENEKIDLLQLDNRIALSMSIEFNKVERVLMALSISSSPIEDLISYLHE